MYKDDCCNKIVLQKKTRAFKLVFFIEKCHPNTTVIGPNTVTRSEK